MANALRIMRKENNLQEKNLTKENNNILTDMIIYMKSHNLIEYDVEVMRKELIGMALEAQLRNEKFSDVIGEDYKSICNDLMESARKQTKGDFILQSISITILCVTILYIFEIFLGGKTIVNIVKNQNFTIPITLGFIISTILTVIFAMSIYMFISRKSFELSEKKNSKIRIFFIIGFSVFWGTILLCKLIWGKVNLFSVNCLYPLVVLVIGCIGFQMFESYKINKLVLGDKA